MDQPQRAPAAGRTIVDGIVLAAGRSRRMGRPKALLPLDDESFLERAIRVLRDGGCRAVIVVVSGEDEEVVRRAEQAGAKVVVNRAPGAEQADSLRAALAEVEEEAAAAAVLPVDHPLVQPHTVERLLAAFREHAAPIVRPTYRGVPGHPGIFARRLFRELADPELPRGAHSVIEAHADEVVDVPVHDPGVVADIDTPDDYRRLVEGCC